MDLRALVTISTLLLINAESDETTPGLDVRGSPLPTESNSTGTNCSCLTAAPENPATLSPDSSPPSLGLLKIRWIDKCVGDVHLILYLPSNSTLPVCHGSETHIQSLLRNLCENQKGCKDTPRWDKGGQTLSGYYITENGAEEESSCETLKIRCTVEVLADVQSQLSVYKMLTAFLCCVLLVLLLIRFTRPTVKALQKRLSDRRQNRWIGPTQSHSVSYHRGKSAVKNSDGENRLSYPALERLAVSDSREPSSNRNSDYNF